MIHDHKNIIVVFDELIHSLGGYSYTETPDGKRTDIGKAVDRIVDALAKYKELTE